MKLDTDPTFQERWWRLERIAWVLMGLLVIAALCGLTGAGGPLSRGQVQAGSAIIDYPRIARWQSAEHATIRFAADATGEVPVLLSPAFAEAFDVEAMMPDPVQTRSTAAGHELTFDLGQDRGPKLVTLSLRPGHPGLPAHAAVRIGDAPPARLGFVVLP